MLTSRYYYNRVRRTMTLMRPIISKPSFYPINPKVPLSIHTAISSTATSILAASIKADLTIPSTCHMVETLKPLSRLDFRVTLTSVVLVSRKLLMLSSPWMFSLSPRAFHKLFKGAVALPRDPRGLTSDKLLFDNCEIICENRF